MHHVFSGDTVWVHAKPSAKIKNGWCVFSILLNFILGPQYVTNISNELKLNLHRFSYDGEKRLFISQNFVNFHKGQHIIANGLMKYLYSGFDDNYKVRMLMNVIKTNTLDAFKSFILASPKMQGHFDIAVRHFLEFISMTPSLQKKNPAKVSSMSRSRSGRGVGRGSECTSEIHAESDVQYVMVAIKKK